MRAAHADSIVRTLRRHAATPALLARMPWTACVFLPRVRGIGAAMMAFRPKDPAKTPGFPWVRWDSPNGRRMDRGNV